LVVCHVLSCLSCTWLIYCNTDITTVLHFQPAGLTSSSVLMVHVFKLFTAVVNMVVNALMVVTNGTAVSFRIYYKNDY